MHTATPPERLTMGLHSWQIPQHCNGHHTGRTAGRLLLRCLPTVQGHGSQDTLRSAKENQKYLLVAVTRQRLELPTARTNEAAVY